MIAPDPILPSFLLETAHQEPHAASGCVLLSPVLLPQLQPSPAHPTLMGAGIGSTLGMSSCTRRTWFGVCSKEPPSQAGGATGKAFPNPL